MDPHQFLDQIDRTRRMLGFAKTVMIELVGYQLDDMAHYWFMQHVEQREVANAQLTWE